MSVIKTLKGALNNVQQVGSSGIKSLKKKSHKPKVYPGVEGVELDAGADLLNKFQQQWAEMHQSSDHNARAAQKVDQTLRVQYDRCEQQTEAMNQLMSLVSGLPHLLKDINLLVDKISAIQDQFQQVEDDLVMLTDVSEAAEMKTNERHHHHQLAVYRQRKARDLEHDKVQLANDHAKKVEGYEAKLQEHLRVKQEAFEEAFAREMANYRQYGSTDMKPVLSGSPQHVELGDISIDQDTSALDAFLESDEVTSESTTDTITIEEDEDDEDSYVNIGIVSNDLSDPELETGRTETETKTMPEVGESAKKDTEKVVSPTKDSGDGSSDPGTEEKRLEKSESEINDKGDESVKVNEDDQKEDEETDRGDS